MCVSSTSWCQHAKIRQLGYCLLQVCKTTESPRWQMCSRRCNSNADGRRYQEGTWETQGHLCGLPWSGGVSRSGPSPGEAVSANVMPASKGALGMLAMSGLSLLLSSLFRQSETASLAFAELPEPTTMHKKVTRVPHHYCGRLFL